MIGGGLGPLGRRLLVAFVAVALSSVAVLTVAALLAAERGVSVARQTDRDAVAQRAATAAADAYAAAGGWQGADLRPARAVAEATGARLMVRDRDGSMVMTPGGGGPPAGHGPGMGGAAAVHGAAERPVVVAGSTVGSVRLLFGTAAAGTAQSLAWSWIIAAGVTALAAALIVSWFVTRRLTRPLALLARTAAAFAAGDRAARSGVRGPGELGEVGRAFDAMAAEIQRAESRRRNLAADVAHELRTPLAALRAGLEELRDGLVAPEPTRLASLHDQALRLGRIVADLAELSAAESAALSLRRSEVDLAEVARRALAAREPELRAAGLEVRRELAEGVRVDGDPDRLYQAVGNLLANAARYCRPGDAVTVSVRAAGDDARIEVADTGPGIPAAELPHVFERLWRGRSSAGVSGSGIGLAVVRELVVAHGGAVWAESGPSGGARFAIRLPRRAPIRSRE